ncbi:hypothetical protein [Salinicola sp. DM10]|uniref:hypothetical protein n=1 Tax=Salinicola sp. DM10 TaxID=2815721 RepID=UPI001A8CCDB3|nr:hypothetical protein [Salinicola sp. DM10]MCE3028817.1 hypothetical protein [Salinicola sp. DM10]
MATTTQRDGLRRMAIASQAVGFVAIIALETWLGDAARPWQGLTLVLMLLAAGWLALARRYRRNRERRRRDAARDDV